MPDYRLFTIGIDGHFIKVDFLTNHADDATAIEAAKQLVDGRDLELWDRDRLVAKIARSSK